MSEDPDHPTIESLWIAISVAALLLAVGCASAPAPATVTVPTSPATTTDRVATRMRGQLFFRTEDGVWERRDEDRQARASATDLVYLIGSDGERIEYEIRCDTVGASGRVDAVPLSELNRDTVRERGFVLVTRVRIEVEPEEDGTRMRIDPEFWWGTPDGGIRRSCRASPDFAEDLARILAGGP